MARAESRSTVLILVDPQRGVPIFRQVMDQIKFHIASGQLEAGDPLPSTRVLSSQLGVNPMTISKAYSFLEKEGVVDRQPGRPLLVRAQRGRAARAAKLEQLRESLEPGVAVVRRLGIERDEAVELLRRMLEEREP